MKKKSLISSKELLPFQVAATGTHEARRRLSVWVPDLLQKESSRIFSFIFGFHFKKYSPRKLSARVGATDAELMC